ncbi:MAG: PIN domain-containing protein [Candidatus Dormibacteraceae bacterium]
MALIVDAGGLYAQADADEPRHVEVKQVLETERETLVTSELAVAEADYLILDRLGLDAEFAFLEDLAAGTFVAECLSRRDLGIALSLVRRYGDLRLGLADASLVVLADRFNSARILTFDERAFRRVVPLAGGSFTVLPADRPR